MGLGALALYVIVLAIGLAMSVACLPGSRTGATAAPSPILQPLLARSDATGSNLALFHATARRYATQNPAFIGVVTVATLAALLPPGYNALGPWVATISPTAVTSYPNAALAGGLSSWQVAFGLFRAYGYFPYAGYIDGANNIRIPIQGTAAGFSQLIVAPTTPSPVGGLAVGTPIVTSTR